MTLISKNKRRITTVANNSNNVSSHISLPFIINDR